MWGEMCSINSLSTAFPHHYLWWGEGQTNKLPVKWRYSGNTPTFSKMNWPSNLSTNQSIAAVVRTNSKVFVFLFRKSYNFWKYCSKWRVWELLKIISSSQISAQWLPIQGRQNMYVCISIARLTTLLYRETHCQSALKLGRAHSSPTAC